MEFYGDTKWGILFCEYSDFNEFLEKNKELIKNYKIETDQKKFSNSSC